MKIVRLALLFIVLQSSTCYEPIPEPGFNDSFFFNLTANKINKIIYSNSKGFGDTLIFSKKTNLPLDMNDHKMHYKIFEDELYKGDLILDYSFNLEVRRKSNNYESIFAFCSDIKINSSSTLDSIAAHSHMYDMDTTYIVKSKDFSAHLNGHSLFQFD